MAEIPIPGLFPMTRWRALYLDFRVWLGLLLFEQPYNCTEPLRRRYPQVVNIGFGQIIKMNSSPVEVAIMIFVDCCLAVPVPKIYGAWYRDGKYYQKKSDYRRCCVLMQRVKGQPLGNVWNTLSIVNQEEIVASLGEYVQCLRRMRRPKDFKGRICSFFGGRMQDPGISSSGPVGPFSPKKFVDYLLDTYLEKYPVKEAYFRKILSNPMTISPVLTHGDLHPWNIIVDKDRKTGRYKITGIVDWTTAGWRPTYWEAFKATPLNPDFWNDQIVKFAGNYTEEVDVLCELDTLTSR